MSTKKLFLMVVAATICVVANISNVYASGYYDLVIEFGDSNDVDFSHPEEQGGLSGGAGSSSSETNISGNVNVSAWGGYGDRAVDADAYAWITYTWTWIPDPQDPNEIPPGGILYIDAGVDGTTVTGGHCYGEYPDSSAYGSADAYFSCDVFSSYSGCYGSAQGLFWASGGYGYGGSEYFNLNIFEYDIEQKGWSIYIDWDDADCGSITIDQGTTSFSAYFVVSCSASGSIEDDGESVMGQGVGSIDASINADFSSN